MRLFLDVVDTVAGLVAVFAEPESFAQTRDALFAAPHLTGTEHGQDQFDFGVALGCAAENVQAVADLDVLDLTQPPVDVQEHVVEHVFFGTLREAEVVVHLGCPHQRPDLLANGRQLGRVQCGDVGVLVEQLLETGDVAVAFGAGHRWDQVIDECRVGTTLCLCSFTRVVDQEGVDQRQVAEGCVGAAVAGHAERLARQPFEVAVLAEVHNGVGAESAVVRCCSDPAVGREVVVARRQIRVVVDRDGLFTESPRRLDHEDDVVESQCRDDDFAVRILRAVDVQLSGRCAPVLFDAAAQFLGQGGEPFAVLRCRDADRIALELLGSEPVGILSAGRDQGMDQRVAVLRRQAGNCVRTVDRTEIVTGRTHFGEQVDCARRSIETDRVADAGVLGRVRREHQSNATLGGGNVAQLAVTDRDPGDTGSALDVGDVRGQSVGVDFLEGERDGNDAAVEFRHRDLGRDVERRQSVVVLVPGGAATGQAQALQDGDVERSECGDIPGFVVATGGRGRGLRATGSKNCHDHGVGAAERAQKFGFCGSQRCAVDRQRGATGLGDRVAQRLDVPGVSGQMLGAVVQNCDDRTARRVEIGREISDAPGRQVGRRFEPVAGEQDGVGQEVVQLCQILCATLGQVVVRLGSNAGGNRRALHEVGVRRVLAAENDYGESGGEDHVQAVFPAATAAEDTNDHEVDAVEQGRQVLRDQQA